MKNKNLVANYVKQNYYELDGNGKQTKIFLKT